MEIMEGGVGTVDMAKTTLAFIAEMFGIRNFNLLDKSTIRCE